MELIFKNNKLYQLKELNSSKLLSSKINSLNKKNRCMIDKITIPIIQNFNIIINKQIVKIFLIEKATRQLKDLNIKFKFNKQKFINIISTIFHNDDKIKIVDEIEIIKEHELTNKPNLKNNFGCIVSIMNNKNKVKKLYYIKFKKKFIDELYEEII